MRRSVEAPLDFLLRRSPLQPLFNWRASRRLTVLAYHGIDHPEQFERQLDYLATHSHPVSLDQVVAALEMGGGLPRRAVLLTFDDGERSILDLGMPMLRERGLPAVSFVVAGLLDGEEPYWWREVEDLVRAGGSIPEGIGWSPERYLTVMKSLPDHRRLALIAELRRSSPTAARRTPQLRRPELALLESAGIAVGNHSLTHPCLDRCTTEKLEHEVHAAHRVLTEALGRSPRAFAYPNGNWDARVLRAVEEAGYAIGFVFDHRSKPFPPAHRLLVSRVWVSSHTSLDRLAISLNGLHPSLHRARMAARGLLRRPPADLPPRPSPTRR